MTKELLKGLIISDYSNQRKEDKRGIAYAIHAIDRDCNMGWYPDDYKRSELLAKFIELLNTDKGWERISNFTPYKDLKDSYLVEGDTFVITEDVLEDNKANDNVIEYVKTVYPFKFKMFDDDCELYYIGYSKDCNSDLAFNPLDDYGTPNAGATEIQYKDKSGKYQTL